MSVLDSAAWAAFAAAGLFYGALFLECWLWARGEGRACA